MIELENYYADYSKPCNLTEYEQEVIAAAPMVGNEYEEEGEIYEV